MLFIFLGTKLFVRGLGSSHGIDILLWMMLIAFLTASRKGYCLVLLPVSFVAGVYYPILRAFGPASAQHISSLIATNLSEAYEFVSLLSLRNCILGLLIPISFYLAYRLASALTIRPSRNRFFVILFALICLIKIDVGSFGKNLHEALRDVEAEQAEIARYAQENAWTGIERTEAFGRYDVYVLVVGESARRDHFALYGYPYAANTPFLSSTPGTFVDGLVAADVYTIGSLRLMLTHAKDRKADFSRTLPGLAVRSGIRTYWFSNQGRIGVDTPVTAIASQSDVLEFTHEGSFDSAALPDTTLLPKLRRALKEKSANGRLIVLHTLGSHSNVCLRARYAKERLAIYDERLREEECYTSSIRATDEFLGRVRDELKASGLSWSLVYFSDHGLGMQRDEDGRVRWLHASPGPRYVAVPLVRINSNDTERRMITAAKEGTRFLEGLAYWLGVSGGGLAPFDLFDETSYSFDATLGGKVNPSYNDPPLELMRRY